MEASMTTLQSRWYNGLTTSLPGLERSTFQISQPCPPIPATDEGLWGYANVLPPASLTFDRSLFADTFFDAYAAVIGQLAPPVNELERVIGTEAYGKWRAYLATLEPQPELSQLPQIFKRWADTVFLTTAQAGTSALMAYALAVAAHEAINPYRGPSAKRPDFGISYGDLLELVRNSSAGTVSIGPGTRAETADTWTQGVDTGIRGLWRGSGPERRLSRLFAAGEVSVEASFQHFAVVVVPPGGWYQSSLLGTALANTTGPPAWVEDADPGWEAVFGTEGLLLRFLSSLVIADGLTATVTSDVDYSPLDQQAVHDHANEGLWPFYAPTGGAVSNAVTFDNRGLTIETSVEAGNPVVLGGVVLATARYLGRRYDR